MDWINKHLGELAGLAVLLGIVAAGFRKWGLPAWRLYRAAQKEIYETAEQRADGYQGLSTLKERQLAEANRECVALKKELKEVRHALTEQVRATLVRDDINRQDRAYIRGLTGRLKENAIDFSDISESIQRQFGNE